MLWRKLQLNWRYALGEFAIVMLGVLAALWVGNWNADRSDRLLEQQYILSLLDDLEADSESIDNALRRSEEFAQSGRTVLSAIEKQQIDVSPAEFAQAVSEAGLLVFSTHSRRTINDLMSTGNLRIIESEDVLAGIADYYATIENRAQWQQNWREYQIHLGKYLPEIINLELRQAISYPDQSALPPWILPIRKITADEAQLMLQRLSEHAHIQPAIENMVRVQAINYLYNDEIKKKLRDLAKNVEDYLGQLQRR